MNTKQGKTESQEEKNEFSPREFVMMLVIVFEKYDSGNMQKGAHHHSQKNTHISCTNL